MAAIVENAGYDAARQGDAQRIREIINEQRSEWIRQPNPEDANRLPLHAAAEGGHVDAVDALLGNMMDTLDTPDRDGLTALHVAADRGHAPVIRRLASLGSKSVDLDDRQGWSPLRRAAQNGHTEAIRALIASGDAGRRAIDRSDEQMRTAMHFAARAGHVEVLQLLVQAGSTSLDALDVDGRTPMHYAAESGAATAITALSELGSRALELPNRCGQHTPIHEAAVAGRPEAVAALAALKAGVVDVRTRGEWTPLCLAAHAGHAGTVEALVQLGSLTIDLPTTDGRTPMFHAAEQGHVPVIEVLVRLGSQALDTPDNNHNTPLHAATLERRLEALEVLAGKTRAIDEPNLEHFTPLGVALQRRHSPSIAVLLAHHADMAICLHDAVYAELLPVCTSLLEFPPLSLARFYDPKTRTLRFEELTDESAAVLPLRNWRSCVAFDFTACPHITETPASLRLLDPTRLSRLLFDVPITWSALDGDLVRRTTAVRSSELIDFAQSKADGAPVSRNECTLVALGGPGSGKTTLFQMLRADDSYTRPLSANGVDLGEVTFSLLANAQGSSNSIRLTMWDFGGQPLHQCAHLAALRTPGVCLLLFRLTDDVDYSVEQLRHWCDLLSTCSPSTTTFARVLLVGTHLDQCRSLIRRKEPMRRRADEILKRLQEHFPRIVEPPQLVSLRKLSKSVAALRSNIFRLAQKANLSVPACLNVVRKALAPVALSDVPLLTYDAADKIIAGYAQRVQHELLATDLQLRAACLRSLRSMGSVMLVEDRGQPTHVVVNPQWVALLLATVVTTRHSHATRGRVTFGTLSSQIWRGDSRFPVETHHMLVAILEQLKVMFTVGKRPDTAYQASQEFFIPCSLPEKRSRGLVPAHGQPCRRHFLLRKRGQSVPIAVVPEIAAQMIANPHAKLKDAWQQGVVFQIKTAAGVVVVSVCKPSHKAVELVVQTNQQHLAAQWVREMSGVIESQLTDAHHLEFEIRIPCRTEYEASDARCFLPFSDVQKCINERQMHTSCQPSQNHFQRIDMLAPDLRFTDLGHKSLIHRWSDVELISSDAPMIGRLRSKVDSVAIRVCRYFKRFQHDAHIMSKFEHPNIVRFVGVCLPSDQPGADHERSPALLMEVMNGGTLYESLSDSAGITTICKLASGLVQAIDEYNTNSHLHEAEPSKFPAPRPLGSLDELCDGALGRIGEIFERVFERARSKAEAAGVSALVAQVGELQQQLGGQLAKYHRGPLTASLSQETNQLINELKAVSQDAAELLVPVEWAMRLKLATDVAQALRYMHSLSPPLVHRNVKSPDVFLRRRLDAIDVEKKTAGWQEPLAKLGDFGLGIRLLGSELTMGNGGAIHALNPTWTAPEVLALRSYGTEADVYGFGVMLWELLTRRHPFSDIPEPKVESYVAAGGRPTIDDVYRNSGDPVMQDYLQLIEQCWHRDPYQRPFLHEVWQSLLDMCSRAAPAVLASLSEHDDAATSSSSDGIARQIDQQYQVVHVARFPVCGLVDGSKVTCLQLVNEHCCWAGLSDGSVLALKFPQAEGQAEPQSVCCTSSDSHSTAVSALIYNPTQQSTVWSGCRGGKISVWSSQVESLEAARKRCFLESRFFLLRTNASPLYIGKELRCVLRNGWLRFFANERAGTPFFEIDLCMTDNGAGMSATVLKNGELDLVTHTSRAIRNTQLGALKLASSSEHGQGYISALEATADATWCLKIQTLTEWRLVGWHGNLRLEPGRHVAFDFDSAIHYPEPNLCSVTALALIAPHLLWISTANEVARLDLRNAPVQPAASTACPGCFRTHRGSCSSHFAPLVRYVPAPPVEQTVVELPPQRPACSVCLVEPHPMNIDSWRTRCVRCLQTICFGCEKVCLLCSACQQPTRAVRPQPANSKLPTIPVHFPLANPEGHANPIRLMAKVEVNGVLRELWTYAYDEDIHIWRTPQPDSGVDAADQDPEFIARLPVDITSKLTCLRQVGSQVWAGTSTGTILGWDVVTRAPLERPPLPVELRFKKGEARRATSAIVASSSARSLVAVAAGQEQNLRKFVFQCG